MRMGTIRIAGMVLAIATSATVFGENAAAPNGEVLKPVADRYAKADVTEEPDFQKHVGPLLGRLGCNGRSCHGSFQGRGGFRLSLFGYDFQADHDAMLKGEKPRVNVQEPLSSLIIAKPTDEENHEGGERYKKNSWQYHLLRRWIEAGAKYDSKSVERIVRLEVTPSEVLARKGGEKTQLQAIAVWPSGLREDVTPLCRFQTNDEQIAKVDENGLLTSNEVGDTHVVVFYDNAVVPIPVLRPVSDKTGQNYPHVATRTAIDKLVVEKLSKLGVVPSEVCTDAEFLRRSSLDISGTLPSAAEVEKFLADKSPGKRQKKIDELLESPAYAAWQTTRLCDFTGNNGSKFPNFGMGKATASQSWYNWIYKRVVDNVPYDQIIEGIVLGVSRDPGESYLEYCDEMSDIARGDDGCNFASRQYMPLFWARRDATKPEDRAIAFAYSFMGMRIQCAQCHKHPFDQWSKDDFDQFKAFFAGVKSTNGPAGSSKEDYAKILADLGYEKDKKVGNNEQKELAKFLKEGKTIPFYEVYLENKPAQDKAKFEKQKAKGDKRVAYKAVTAKLLGGDVIDLADYPDNRKPVMDWLRAKDNPILARAFVNRTWANYFNVGIVEPSDDLSLANPPSNKPLMDYLAQGFIEHNFDIKWLHREICNSDTYQRSWRANETNGLDERNFSRAVPRRLPAEVAVDAVQFALLSDQKAEVMRNEVEKRSVAIASSDNRQQGGKTFGLTVFGRSIRESNCDCDRSMESSLLQTVFLQNDDEVIRLIQAQDGWVSQVVKERVSKVAAAKATNEKVGRDREQAIKALEKQIGRLAKQEKTEEANKLKEKLADMMKEAKASKTEQVVPALTLDEVKPLINEAYLRTLSRTPTADEFAIANQFVQESTDPATGLRGVMWALVNTKEFIVNH